MTPPAAGTVRLYDTTLRDGTQREGVSLSVEDKLRIARELDVLGVHYIEGGWPGSNPKDAEFFERMHRELVHLLNTERPKVTAEVSAGVAASRRAVSVCHRGPPRA